MDIPDAARTFIGEAFDALRKEYVIPTPVFHPYVHVGRDYYGDTIHTLASYNQLEQELSQLYPWRFSDPLSRHHPEFPNTYIFSLLEAAIAACGRLGYHDEQDYFDARHPAVSEVIEEFVRVLDSRTYEVVCCRFVSHLTTRNDAEIRIGRITVIPEPPGFGGLNRRIASEVAGGWSAFNREDPRPFDKPHALLVARVRTDEPDPYDVAQRLSGQLERFLLLARLFSAGTVYSHYEVKGSSTAVSRFSPHLSEFRGSRTLVRRTVWLAEHHAQAFEAIGALLDEADVKRDGMAATSFDVALAKFNASHHQENPYETLVDLATALEAILASGEADTEALTLRLRNRAAALLATERDPAREIFTDVGVLYGLRSKLVHGGQMKESDLRRELAKISTMPMGEAQSRLGIAIGYAVDRIRDLVRRAILARLCLAGGPDSPWPFTGSTAVDASLSDDATRAEWRTQWHQKLAALGVEASAEPPRTAVDFLTPPEHEDQAQREPRTEKRGTTNDEA